MKSTNKIIVSVGRGGEKVYSGRPERFLEFALPLSAGDEVDVDLTRYAVLRVALKSNGDFAIYVEDKP